MTKACRSVFACSAYVFEMLVRGTYALRTGRGVASLTAACVLFFTMTAEAEGGASYVPTPETTEIAALFSMAVYRGEENGLAWRLLEAEGFEPRIVTISGYRTAVGTRVANGRTERVLAIAGTESKAGLRLDLETSIIPLIDDDTEAIESGSDILVHRGYAKLSRDILDSEAFRALVGDTDGPILLTGHSLGGAVALITALTSSIRDDAMAARIEVVTFGAPLIGNPKAAESLNAIHYRAYEMESDPIPRAFQILHDRYRGSYASREKWRSYAPDLDVPHAMFLYMDEAIRRRYVDRTEADEVQGNRIDIRIRDGVGLPSEALRAYRNAIRFVLSGDGKSAEASGHIHVEVDFIKNKESLVGNYHAVVVIIVDDNPERAVFRVVTDGGYTLLPQLIDGLHQARILGYL